MNNPYKRKTEEGKKAIAVLDEEDKKWFDDMSKLWEAYEEIAINHNLDLEEKPVQTRISQAVSMTYYKIESEQKCAEYVKNPRALSNVAYRISQKLKIK